MNLARFNQRYERAFVLQGKEDIRYGACGVGYVGFLLLLVLLPAARFLTHLLLAPCLSSRRFPCVCACLHGLFVTVPVLLCCLPAYVPVGGVRQLGATTQGAAGP